MAPESRLRFNPQTFWRRWPQECSLRYPDVAGRLVHGERQAVRPDGRTEPRSGADRISLARRTVNADRLTHGTLRGWMQALRPHLRRSARRGEEIDDVAVRRPPGSRVGTRPIGHRDPFGLSRSLLLTYRNQVKRARRLRVGREMKGQPAPVGRIRHAVDVVLRMLQNHLLLAARHVHRGEP